VLTFVNIPHGNIIYAVLGIVIFGGYTIFDFNRLRRADMSSSVPIGRASSSTSSTSSSSSSSCSAASATRPPEQ
jgi:FtsH-binding integral membrane protein